MKQMILLLALMFTLVGCGKTKQLESNIGSRVDTPIAQEFNNLFEVDDLYFAGYPTENGLRAMADRGVNIIVCTKTPSQVTNARGFDETLLAQELGMKIVWIPISPSSFNMKDVDAFAAVMDKRSAPMLIHCGSSNTVGGLWAAYLHTHRGVPLDDAITQGKSVGLHAPVMIDAVIRVTN